jgi:hypothetical protein
MLEGEPDSDCTLTAHFSGSRPNAASARFWHSVSAWCSSHPRHHYQRVRRTEREATSRCLEFVWAEPVPRQSVHQLGVCPSSHTLSRSLNRT